MVTHRIESVVDCDRVYLLEGGRIARVAGPRDVIGESLAIVHGARSGGAGAAA